MNTPYYDTIWFTLAIGIVIITAAWLYDYIKNQK
jgi:hypothetical protein